MEERNNTENMIPVPKEDLEFIRKMKEKEELNNRIKEAEEKYTSDPQLKPIWDAGFGEKIKKNPSILNNKDHVEDVLSMFVEKVKASHQKQESIPATGTGVKSSPPIDQSSSEPIQDNSNKIDMRKETWKTLMEKGLSSKAAILVDATKNMK